MFTVMDLVTHHRDPVQFVGERDLDQPHELVGVARHELHSVGQGRVAGLTAGT